MNWLAREWELQWPLIRFEAYRWGVPLAASGLIVLGAKLLHSVFKIPDTYFYGSMFVLCCICFVFLASRLPRAQGTGSAAKQSTEALAPLSASLPPTVQQMTDYYNDLDVQFTRETDTAIRGEINKIPIGNERDTFIMRALVSTAVVWQLEEIWHTIYGSQIKALELLNTGMVKRDALLPFYIAAAAGWPQSYALDTFDRWIGWLRTNNLIAEQGDRVGISVKGVAFLKLMLQYGRSANQRLL